MPTIDHLALAVRDPDRSLGFYREVLAVEGEVRAEEYGHVITTPGGLAFTLFRGEPSTAMGETHLGVSLASAAEVVAARDRFRVLGLREVEWCQEPGYTSVKIADPDGYLVEVAWDEAQPAR